MKMFFIWALQSLWARLVLLFRILATIILFFWGMVQSLLRFFIAAPLLATWVIFRSPRGMKKDRWIAWRLARAHRFGRKLSVEKRQRLEQFLEAKILREVKRPSIVENQMIEWETIFLDLVPRKDLEVRT
tara:strand:- start:12067 stop:12456 length:390 start_codon:yes stop_codon:yes gene_type:complete